MATMKTPGVYILEKNAFPNSVVEVATAVPAFIGYTEIALDGNTSLLNKPWRITSMAEFHTFFGYAPTPKFTINNQGTGNAGKDDPVKTALKEKVNEKLKVLPPPLTEDAIVKTITEEKKALIDALTAQETTGMQARIKQDAEKAAQAIEKEIVAGLEKDLKEKLKKDALAGLTGKETTAENVSAAVTAAIKTEETDVKTVTGLATEEIINEIKEELIREILSAPEKQADVAAQGENATTPKEAAEKSEEENLPLASSSFSIPVSTEETYTIKPCTPLYTLYYHMLLFYANGGGPCYIVSVGDYNTEPSSEAITNALILLEKEQEPTLIVVPEAINFGQDECTNIQTAMLGHCGQVMQNRFAIFDIWNGIDLEHQGKSVSDFREKIGSNHLAYCASYFPWLNTSVITDKYLSMDNLDWKIFDLAKDATTNWPKAIKDIIINYDEKIQKENNDKKIDADKKKEKLDKLRAELHAILAQNWGIYKNILAAIKQRMNLLPPSGAMAGIYTMVDNSRGVWKAPANLSINNVVSPTCNLTNADQEDLNVPLTGKAVNAIRTFIGEGIKIWGARTMDGNSLDWRYINVRRTMIFMEESIKNATRAYVFEPNDAGTWVNMRGMIENFLKSVWKRGGLAGASPEDAFSVHVGLGDTMTPEDILEGILRITVLVAITRPAEFIEITFQQQMQKS